MSLFVLTTLQCLWISVTLDEPNPDAMLPNAGFAITMTLITISLLVLLPYFIFVFSFLSPLSMIEQLRRRATRALSRTTRDGIAACQSVVTGSIDELQEVARSAIEKSDRAVAPPSLPKGSMLSNPDEERTCSRWKVFEFWI